MNLSLESAEKESNPEGEKRERGGGPGFSNLQPFPKGATIGGGCKFKREKQKPTTVSRITNHPFSKVRDGGGLRRRQNDGRGPQGPFGIECQHTA